MTDFEQIYQVYFGDVFRYLRRLTGSAELAEELTAETFLKALSSIDQYKGEGGLRIWLCQIGKNSYYSYLRKNSRIRPDEPLEECIEPEDPVDMAQVLADKDDAMRIHTLLHGLEEPYKEVFSLRVFGELSFKEIARLFDKTENWACVTFYRAKQKIQRGFEGKEGFK